MLRPTVMACVPLILDRIYKGIYDNVHRKGKSFQEIFEWAYQYKLRAYTNGESTPILDRLVFRPLRAMLGGQVRLVVTGGAPLSPETSTACERRSSCSSEKQRADSL